MKLKNVIFLFIAILATIKVEAQSIRAHNATQIEHQLENYYNDIINRKIGEINVIAYDKIQGDPFLYKDFTKGSIKFEKDKNIVGELRYNMYSDEIEFKHRDRVFVLVYEDAFEGVVIGDHTLLRLIDPLKKEANTPGYFDLMVKGTYNLYCKRSASYYEEEKPKLYVESKPGRFEQDPNKFFLNQTEDGLYEIKNIAKLKKYSPEMAALVEEYISDHKLKINEKSLNDFFKWVNAK